MRRTCSAVFAGRLMVYAMITLLPLVAAGQTDELPPEEATHADTDEESIHQELRALRDELIEAVLAGDVDKQLQYAHPNIVVTWQNNDSVQGRDGLKEYMDRMNIGENGIFRGYRVRPTADTKTILYGDNFGIVTGTSLPHYKIAGMEFDLENRWTATLVREDEGWRLAAYHVSGNILDNAVLTIAKRSVYWVGGLAFALGLALGAAGMFLAGRKRRRGAL